MKRYIIVSSLIACLVLMGAASATAKTISKQNDPIVIARGGGGGGGGGGAGGGGAGAGAGAGSGAALALVLARALVAQAWVPGLGQVRVKGIWTRWRSRTERLWSW